MNKTELIELTQELLNAKSLEDRKEDLLFLKREYKHYSNREEESFYEQQLTNKFINLYLELAKKEPKLVQSSADERKEIITMTKALMERNDIIKASKDLDNYVEAFKRAGSSSKEQDDALWAEFREAKNAFLNKKKEYFENLDKANEEKKAKKLEIIAKAKELLVIKNIKESNDKMDALMSEWKAVGFSGRDNDQALWNEFSEVRKEFEQKKREHHHEMIKEFDVRAEKKEQMIKDLKKLIADAYFTPEEVKHVKQLDQDFKRIGFAGKEKDDDLFQRWNEAMKQYFEEKKFYAD